MKLKNIFNSFLLCIVLVLLLLPLSNFRSNAAFIQNNEKLIARVGGGESYGSGGYDSSSSSSSNDWGSSSSDSSYYSSGTSGTGNPYVTCCIVIVIIIIIIIDAIMKRRGGKGFITYGGAKGGSTMVTPTPSASPNVTNKSMTAEEITKALADFKVLDPDFDQQKFKIHVKKVFMAAQEGWTNRDQKVCRPFLAEEIYQSHQMQIDNMLKNKVINKLENIVVGATDFARVDISEDYHKITMKIRAAMKDYKVKEDAPEVVIEGSKDQQPPFTEYWAFIRKATLKTKIKDGIFDRKCPNCGAPIDVDVAGTCKYCNANVVNGDYDWVLSEIIQREEWEG
jgi:predicted lipid-binding transport protein (Tim44 family)